MKSFERWILLSFVACLQTVATAGSVDDVDVFIGTSNSRWQMFPGATLPFGLVKFSPDNQGNVWNGGYEYTVGSISGFSHLHAMALSGVSLMPFTGSLQGKTFPGPADGSFGAMWTAGYRSRYRKEDEHASPGYYGVYLLDSKVEAELTSTMRCGMMRLTYPASDDAHLILNFDFPTEEKTQILAVDVKQTGPAEISGSIRQRNQYALEFTVHFVLQLNRPFDSLDAWRMGNYTGKDDNYGTDWRRLATWGKNIHEFSGSNSCGLVLNFKTRDSEKILVRTGISLVSLDGARNNLETEMKPFGWDLDTVVASARKIWNQLLGVVKVEGGKPEERKMFYTCLYHTYSGKSVISDCDGQYLDANGQLQKLAPVADAFYSSDGFWGTQWTLSPLWTLLAPRVANSWVNFFLEEYRHAGWTPEAPVKGNFSPIMCAQHHQSLIISSWQKGIRGFDGELAWQAVWHDLTTPGQPFGAGGFAGNRHLAPYLKQGYVPEEAGPVSSTMEYAYDDWAAAQFGLALGHTNEAAQLLRRSQNWRNVFDPQTGYVRRKHTDGSWVEPFDPFQFGTTGGWNGPGYVEGTAWIYTWSVPQDLPGLVKLLGTDKFNARLEEGFAKGFVDLGNEPNLQAPFLFNYSGKPWLAQKYSRFVLQNYFDPTPYVGSVGEEDEGQLSAYYALLAMGLFEMNGGCAAQPGYDIGSPIFDKITLRLDSNYYGGKTFVIQARNNSEKNIYIQSATLNGKPLSEARISHADIVKGGRLVLRMGSKPNEKWGGVATE